MLDVASFTACAFISLHASCLKQFKPFTFVLTSNSGFQALSVHPFVGLFDLFVKKKFFSLRCGVPRIIRKITFFLYIKTNLVNGYVSVIRLFKVDEKVFFLRMRGATLYLARSKTRLLMKRLDNLMTLIPFPSSEMVARVDSLPQLPGPTSIPHRLGSLEEPSWSLL
jgi:hypothetical protein